MHPPTHFQEHNIERLQALVEQFPLASILMPCSQSDLNNICQVPVLFEHSRNVFMAHVAKHNPLAQCDKQSVKLLFSGDNCYLSPSYSNNKTLLNPTVAFNLEITSFSSFSINFLISSLV